MNGHLQSDRHLVLILGVCIVIIGIMSGVKIQYVLDQQQDTRIPEVSRVNIDPRFFDVEPESQPAGVLESMTSVEAPVITARAYLVGNAKTGKIYLESNSAAVLPVASMSKLVTAFVATDVFTATSTFTITEDVLRGVPPDTSGLYVDEQFTREEILKPLLLSSSNVAAETMASSMDRREFLELMSGYAWEVGMPHSFFADPSGLSPSNAASARDIFGLARYLINFRPDILAVTRLPRFWLATTTEHGSHDLVSTHPFVDDIRFIGGKTGRTLEAGETMLTLLRISDEPIALIVMGSRYGAREGDTRMLLERFTKEGGGAR